MKPEIDFKQFQDLDIRIGTVIKAEVPAWSHWVMRLTVDFGPSFAEATEGQGRYRTIFAGIMKFYKPEDMEGNQYPFIVNLKPKKMGPEGDYSEGMMLAASTGETEDDKPVLLHLSEPVPNGSVVR